MDRGMKRWKKDRRYEGNQKRRWKGERKTRDGGERGRRGGKQEKRELLFLVAVETQNLICCSWVNYMAAWDFVLVESDIPCITFCVTIKSIEQKLCCSCAVIISALCHCVLIFGVTLMR